VREAKPALSFWAAWPLDSWKEDEEEEEEEEAESELSLVAGAEEATAGVAAAGVEIAGAEADEAVDPSPVKPPVAPVAAIRASASLWVAQVIEVPALLTKGRAAHVVPPAHEVVTKAPLTH